MALQIHKCNRCDWEWVSRGGVKEPKECPHCKNKYWNKKRRYRLREAYA